MKRNRAGLCETHTAGTTVVDDDAAAAAAVWTGRLYTTRWIEGKKNKKNATDGNFV